MDKNKLQQLEQEYSRVRPDLDRFKDSIIVQIEKLLEIKQIPLGFPIQNRTKDWLSIVDKIESGRFNLKKSVKELQDLVGLRIILLFNRDVERVCDLLQENLKVIKKYDTANRLKEDQFGYSSVHFVVSIPDVWQSVPTFMGLEQYIAEIQVRTLAQHTWSEASRELQYKQEENVPRPLLRSIGRVSALLETVDLEFERLLKERELYKNALGAELSSSDNALLNVDVLEAILDKHLPTENKKITEPYSDLLEDLKRFEVNNQKKLEEIIQTHLQEVLAEDKRIVSEILAQKSNNGNMSSARYHYDMGRPEKGVFYAHVGLLRAMLEIEFGKKWKEYMQSKAEKKKKK